MNDKKQIESAIINQFRNRFRDFPKGSLKPSESPDFIVGVTPKAKIGIELTRLDLNIPGNELLSYDNLKACLETKNEKLPLYRKQKLNEYWLIIHIDDLPSWKRINIHNKLMTWVFETGFNRVFLFNTKNGKVLELNH